MTRDLFIPHKHTWRVTRLFLTNTRDAWLVYTSQTHVTRDLFIPHEHTWRATELRRPENSWRVPCRSHSLVCPLPHRSDSLWENISNEENICLRGPLQVWRCSDQQVLDPLGRALLLWQVPLLESQAGRFLLCILWWLFWVAEATLEIKRKI